MPTIQQAIHDHVEVGSQLFTDEHKAYSGLDGLFFHHQAINHSGGEYLADALQIMLTQADAVLFLANWHESRGARIEMFTAGECGIPMYFKADQLPRG